MILKEQSCFSAYQDLASASVLAHLQSPTHAPHTLGFLLQEAARRPSEVHTCASVVHAQGPWDNPLLRPTILCRDWAPTIIPCLNFYSFVCFSQESDELNSSFPGNQLWIFVFTNCHRKRRRWWVMHSHQFCLSSWAFARAECPVLMSRRMWPRNGVYVPFWHGGPSPSPA